MSGFSLMICLCLPFASTNCQPGISGPGSGLWIHIFLDLPVFSGNIDPVCFFMAYQLEGSAAVYSVRQKPMPVPPPSNPKYFPLLEG